MYVYVCSVICIKVKQFIQVTFAQTSTKLLYSWGYRSAGQMTRNQRGFVLAN